MEVFHLSFVRALLRGVPSSKLAIKGGYNIRFFFGSPRYSEGIDVDVTGIPVVELRDKVMRVLESGALLAAMRVAGVESLVPPELAHSKQTETVQRFKVHLLTPAGLDIATKIEFSRRGLDKHVRAESVRTDLISEYRLPPLIAPHYAIGSAVRQKIRALVDRRQPEPRDVFDLHILAPFALAEGYLPSADFDQVALDAGRERVLGIDYERYRDEVVTLLAAEDQLAYDSSEYWDEIRLAVIALLERQA